MAKTSIKTQEIVRNILMQVAIETLSLQNKGWDADRISQQVANKAVEKVRIICCQIESDLENNL